MVDGEEVFHLPEPDQGKSQRKIVLPCVRPGAGDKTGMPAAAGADSISNTANRIPQ